MQDEEQIEFILQAYNHITQRFSFRKLVLSKHSDIYKNKIKLELSKNVLPEILMYLNDFERPHPFQPYKIFFKKNQLIPPKSLNEKAGKKLLPLLLGVLLTNKNNHIEQLCIKIIEELFTQRRRIIKQIASV